MRESWEEGMGYGRLAPIGIGAYGLTTGHEDCIKKGKTMVRIPAKDIKTTLSDNGKEQIL